MIGRSQASSARIEMGVEKRLFVVHLWTLCQKLFMPLSKVYDGVRRSPRM